MEVFSLIDTRYSSQLPLTSTMLAKRWVSGIYLENTMKEIQLTQGKVTIVDDEDYEYLINWKWYYDEYAKRGIKIDNKVISIYMHRLILNPNSNMEVDHINLDKLDNRKINLRVVTTAQNNQNKPKSRNNTSGYTGVNWDKRSLKWCSKIVFNHRQYYLGHFNSPVDAHNAYVKKSIELRRIQ